MWFWVVAGVMVVGAAGVMVRALLRHDHDASGNTPDLQVYRSQLKEIDRDRGRGVLSEAEAEDTRLTIARKMLDADRRARDTRAVPSGAATAMACIGGAVFLALAVLAYFWLGAPGMRDASMPSRLAAADQSYADRPTQSAAEAATPRPDIPPPDPAYLGLMDQLRATVAARPDDQRGLELLARNELNLGNFDASRRAQQALVKLRGDADDYVALAQIDILAAGGLVTETAESALNESLARDPNNGLALYYSGIMMAQNGRPDRAFTAWDKALSTPHAPAPWLDTVRANIMPLAEAAGVQHYQPPPVDDMIQGMVDRLSARLAQQGGPASDWARLIHSLRVMGGDAKAREIGAEAQTKFADDPAALQQINAALSDDATKVTP